MSYTLTSLGTGPATGGYCATSSNGAVILNANFGEYLYLSTNSGATWTTSLGSVNSTTRNWRGVTVSADGTKMAASVAGSEIWVSTDSGATWNNRPVSGDGTTYNAVQYTRDGTKLIIITFSSVYESTDDGVNWSNTGGSGFSSSNCQAICITDNGLKIAYGIESDTNLRIGTYSGSWSWTTVTFGNGIRSSSVGMSGDGSNLSVSFYGSALQYSTDGGSSWSTPTGDIASDSVFVIAISQSGGRYTALSGTTIYTTTNPASTWTSTNASSPYFTLLTGTSDLSTIYLSAGSNPYIYKGTLGAGPEPEPVICFREGSKILTFNPATGREEYTAVENVRPGTLVKTRMSGYVPVCMVGTSTVTIPEGRERTADRLYVCSREQFPELTEDLYITGHHSILVTSLTDAEREECVAEMGRVYLTEGRCRLPAHIARRTRVYEAPGAVERIWHFALDHNDEQMNYGVYANGLLVESCSIWRLRTMVGYELMTGNVYTVSAPQISVPPARLPIVC